MKLSVKTSFTKWSEMKTEPDFKYRHCSTIISHIDRDLKKSCLFLLGTMGVLTIPYKDQL